MEKATYHCCMSNPDLGPILDDLAAGRIDAAEANLRIEDLKRKQKSAEEPSSQQGSDQPRTGGLTRVSITAVGRRVKVVADPSISTLTVEGPHVLRRNGTVMEISSTGDFGPSFSGFSLIRPPRSLDDLRDIGLGKELLVTVNPRLAVDVELTTGGLRTTDVPRLGRIRVTGVACSLEGVNEVSDLLMQAGAVTVEGPINTGRSKLRVESGSLTLVLTAGANVTIRGEAKLGRINWPGDGEGVDEFVVGNGSARIDIGVVMGMATVKVEGE